MSEISEPLYRINPETGRFEPVPAPPAQPAQAYDPQTGRPLANSGPDPTQSALQRARDALKQGAPWDVAAGGFLNALAVAAMRGDRRVVAPDPKDAWLEGQGYQRVQDADGEGA